MVKKSLNTASNVIDVRAVVEAVRLVRRTRRALEPLELTVSELIVLQALRDHPGLSLTATLKDLQFTASEMSITTAKLEGRGLIERPRRGDNPDRRTVICVVTAAGATLLDEVRRRPLDPPPERRP